MVIVQRIQIRLLYWQILIVLERVLVFFNLKLFMLSLRNENINSYTVVHYI